MGQKHFQLGHEQELKLARGRTGNNLEHGMLAVWGVSDLASFLSQGTWNTCANWIFALQRLKGTFQDLKNPLASPTNLTLQPE